MTVGFASWADRAATDELVRRADLALITAKLDGVATRRYARTSRTGRARPTVERAELEPCSTPLGRSCPVFQPIFDLRSHDIVAYEALTRFPADAGHSTQEWFELAHRHGLAVELQAAAVQAALAVPGRPAGVSLSLNISPEVLLTGRDQLGLPDDLTAITIEVTEDALVTEGLDLELALHDLRARGARIAVDDAGAGTPASPSSPASAPTSSNSIAAWCKTSTPNRPRPPSSERSSATHATPARSSAPRASRQPAS